MTMKYFKAYLLGLLFGLLSAVSNTQAAGDKPNILIIWGDDIGMWNISAYHRGMMGGSTPNIDRIAHEGMIFMDHYAHASCTAGRAAFITGQYPIRTVRITSVTGMNTCRQSMGSMSSSASSITSTRGSMWSSMTFPRTRRSLNNFPSAG